MHHADWYRGLEAAARALAATAGGDPGERAAAVHTAMAPHFAATATAPHLACRAGCAHCCRLPVGVTFGEAVRLAAALHGQPDLAAAVHAEARATAGLPWPALAGRACPLLRDERCAVHAARPLPCRALGSTDAEACARALHGPAAVPADDAAFVRGLGAGSALAAAETPAGTRELRAALAAVLAGPPGAAAAAFGAARSAGG